jgi:hypothetical protein
LTKPELYFTIIKIPIFKSMSVIIAERTLSDWEQKGLMDPIPAVKDAPRPSAEIIADWKQKGQLWRGEQYEKKSTLRGIRRANRKIRVEGLPVFKKLSAMARYFWEGDPEGFEATNRVANGLAWKAVDEAPADPEPMLGIRLNHEPQELSSKKLVDEATAYWQDVNPWSSGYDEWRIAYKACHEAAQQEFRKQSGLFGWIGRLVNPRREEVHQIALCASLGILGDGEPANANINPLNGQGLDLDAPTKSRQERTEDVKTLSKGTRRTILSLGFAALVLGSPAAASYTWNESTELGEVLFSTVYEAGQPELVSDEEVSDNFELPATSDSAQGR